MPKYGRLSVSCYKCGHEANHRYASCLAFSHLSSLKGSFFIITLLEQTSKHCRIFSRMSHLRGVYTVENHRKSTLTNYTFLASKIAANKYRFEFTDFKKKKRFFDGQKHVYLSNMFKIVSCYFFLNILFLFIMHLLATMHISAFCIVVFGISSKSVCDPQSYSVRCPVFLTL